MKLRSVLFLTAAMTALLSSAHGQTAQVKTMRSCLTDGQFRTVVTTATFQLSAAQMTTTGSSGLTCAQQSPEQIVASQFPQELKTPPIVAGPSSCFSVFELYPNGKPKLIAAAYTNGASGAFRMLALDEQGSASVLGNVSGPQYELAGAGCRITVVNLAADNSADARLRRTIQLDFPGLSGKGSFTWYFLWGDGLFLNITPLEQLSVSRSYTTQLLNASPVEIVQHHAKEILSTGDVHAGSPGAQEVPTKLLWSFDGQSYRPDKQVELWTEFSRSRGKPKTVAVVTPDSCDPPECVEFDLTAPGPGYALQLFNGSADGSARAASAHVLLNNTEVISPNDVNENVGSLTRMISLKNRNTLYVVLEGVPGSKVSITIVPSASQ